VSGRGCWLHHAIGRDIDGSDALDDARAIASLLTTGASVAAILQLVKRVGVPGAAGPWAIRSSMIDDLHTQSAEV